MNIDKQIAYWIETAESDLQVVDYLLAGNKLLHALFFCHLAVEKCLKAHVVKVTNEAAPKIHKLDRLAEMALLKPEDKQFMLMDTLMVYQLEGRYPDYSPAIPSKNDALILVEEAKNYIQWLKGRL